MLNVTNQYRISAATRKGGFSRHPVKEAMSAGEHAL